MFKTSVRNTEKENQKIIVTNVLKMLSHRGLLNDSDLEKLIKSSYDSVIHNLTFKIKDNKNNTWKCMLVYENLESLNKNELVNTFVTDDQENNRIIILKHPNKKIITKILQNKNIEVWADYELMIHFPDNIYFIPHYLLNDKDKEKVLSDYSINEMPLINVNDRASRYIGAKKNDVIKVIRNNPTTFYNVVYRKVIENDDDLFSMMTLKVK